MSFLRCLGVEEGRLRKIIANSPALLSYNVEAMRAKVSYFKNELRMHDGHVSLNPNLSGLEVLTCSWYTMSIARTNLSGYTINLDI